VSCLVSHDCVLTMSLTVTAKCLFCSQRLAFLVESRPLGPFTRCLLTYLHNGNKMVVHVVVVFWAVMCLDNGNLAMFQSQTV